VIDPPVVRESLARRKIRVSAFGVVVSILVVAITALIVYPIGTMVVRALLPGGHWDSAEWSQTFAGRDLLSAVRNTVLLVIASIVIAVPIGLWFAWLSERTDAYWGFLSSALPVLPLMLPPVALAIGWLFLADPNAGFLTHAIDRVLTTVGIHYHFTTGIDSWPGMIFTYALFIVPQVYVVCAAAFRNVDPSVEEAARVAGGRPFACFFTVSVPAIRSAVYSSILLAGLAAAELYSIAAVIGVPARIPVLSVYIVNLLNAQFPPQTSQAVILGVLMVIVLGIGWVYQRRLGTRRQGVTVSGKGIRPNRIALGAWRWPLRLVMLAYAAIVSVLPALALVLVAFQPYWTPTVDWGGLTFGNFTSTLGNTTSRQALVNSGVLGIVTGTIVCLVSAVLSIYALDVGGIRGRYTNLVTKLPASMPSLILAVGVLVTFGFSPFWLNGTLVILGLTYAIGRLPVASIAAESAVQSIGSEVIEAARVHGAGRGTAFGTVSLPLMAPGLGAAWAMVFSLVLGDLNAAAILSGPQNPVVGYVLLGVYGNGTYGQVAVLGCFIFGLSAICVGLVLWFSRPQFSRRAAAG
jgi:iron(III) transport system permease protein